MTEFLIAHADLPSDAKPIAIHALRPGDWSALSKMLTDAQRRFATARGFTAEAGHKLQLPDVNGNISHVLLGCGPTTTDQDGAMRIGQLGATLPQGYYRMEHVPDGWTPTLTATAWGMGAYTFDRYLDAKKVPPTLVMTDAPALAEAAAAVAATHLCRDLINTPAGDMGPVALAKAAQDLAEEFDAAYSEVVGEDLLSQNYPMIHAVGRAAHEAPRLVEFEWGDPSHPRLAVVGKGITFDTGGVNMKSASGARLMKKDMGGAAHALALSRMIMQTGLPVRLHCLLAIAENAVSANAYRPGDILSSRLGLTVEIDNTDAEGRLVLGDALTKATEDNPRLIVDFATLTGAARVALGPQLPPFFCNREGPVPLIEKHGASQLDPVWRLPLWQAYHQMLSSPIASMKNSGGGFAGCITAALFLERFVKDTPWVHFDTYGWNPSGRAGHPKGADMYGVRAMYHFLKTGGLNARF